MSSSSTQGAAQITVTFKPGTDLDAAQVLVQNRVAARRAAAARAGAPDRRHRTKQSTGFLMIVALTSPDGSLDTDYIGNYANTVVRDRLLRLQRRRRRPRLRRRQLCDARLDRSGQGGGAQPHRDRDRRRASRPERPGRRRRARPVAERQRQSLVRGAGRRPGPARRASSNSRTSRSRPIPAGAAITRLRDVARVELGSQDYSIRGSFGGQRGIALAIVQQPGANSLDAGKRVLDEMKILAKDFPQGLSYSIPYNPTEYVSASVERGAGYLARSGDPGRAGGRRLPADLARGGDPDRRHPDRPDRHVRGAARARLLDQFAVAVRARARGRASWSTTPSSWSRRSRSISAKAWRRARRRTGRCAKCPARWSRSASCWSRCSSRRRWSRAFPASSTASSR